MIKRLQRASPAAWAGIVLISGLLVRLALWLAYQPVAYNDTNSYRRLAASILNGWARYDGTRTPGYPLFLATAGPDERVWLLQMGLGLGTTMLLFVMGWLLSGRAWFGGLAGLAHTLNLGQLFFEANLITETLATFAVTASLAGIFLWLERPQNRGVLLALLISLSASFAWLVRPLFVYLPFWLLLFLAIEIRPPEDMSVPAGAPGRFSVAWGKAAVFLLPAVFILGIWLAFIHNRFHVWNITSMSGYNLIQHTGNYFELLPDEDAALRDTYLKYRQKQIQEHGSQTNAIWEAIPEMERVSGLSFYNLSRKLSDLSFKLIREHPTLYLKYAAKGWWYFWRAPVYWSAEALRWQGVGPILGALILLERAALVGCNLIFVVTSLAALVWRGARRLWEMQPALWCLAGSIWIASILQTLVDHGDNPRFLVPLQSMVVLWVLWILFRSAQAFSGRWARQS